MADHVNSSINRFGARILKYLEKCPDLKVLKFEFKPDAFDYPLFSDMEECIRRFKLKKLQEFHLIGVKFGDFDVKIFLVMIAENFPKLRRLCLTCEDIDTVLEDDKFEIFEKFASEKNIKIETYLVLDEERKCSCGHSFSPVWYFYNRLGPNYIFLFGPPTNL